MQAGVPFIEELVISALMIGATVFFHAVVIAVSAAMFRAAKTKGVARIIHDSVIISILSLILLAAHAVEIWAWAELFIVLDAFDTREAAFYFSAIAYTTLGFGDLLLPIEWRLLAGAIAADGFLLFGLSAAFLFETAGRLRLADERKP